MHCGRVCACLQFPRPDGYTGTEELFGVKAQGREVFRLVTGGLSNDKGLVAAMRESAVEQKLHVDIRADDRSILAGALGAALWGTFRVRRLRRKLGWAA